MLHTVMKSALSDQLKQHSADQFTRTNQIFKAVIGVITLNLLLPLLQESRFDVITSQLDIQRRTRLTRPKFSMGLTASLPIADLQISLADHETIYGQVAYGVRKDSQGAVRYFILGVGDPGLELV